jgi:hypothetical protein
MKEYTRRKFVCNYEDDNGIGHREIFDDMDKGLEFVKTIEHLPYEFYGYDELIED